jgi:hypothetical protein
MRRNRPLLLLTTAAALALPGTARATACVSSTHQSTCFDSDPLWVPAAPTRFVAIPSYRAPNVRAFSLGLAGGYQLRPVVLTTASPETGGREVRVVDQVGDATLVGAFSPAPGLELGLSLPFTVLRSGTGLTGVTSQRGAGLPDATLRDVRLGGGYELWSRRNTGADEAGLIVRLELSLPTGDSSSFAGERGPILAPAFGFGLRHGPVFASAQESVRLRQPVEIGGARLGTQLFSLLGIGADLLAHDRLSVALEAWLDPSLVSQAHADALGVTVASGALIPAEWMVSAQTRLGDFSVAAGGGSAIPLSETTRVAPSGAQASSQFAGITSPALRLTLLVRYEYDATPLR